MSIEEPIDDVCVCDTHIDECVGLTYEEPIVDTWWNLKGYKEKSIGLVNTRKTYRRSLDHVSFSISDF